MRMSKVIKHRKRLKEIPPSSHRTLPWLFSIVFVALMICGGGSILAQDKSAHVAIFMEIGDGGSNEVRMELEAIHLTGQGGPVDVPLYRTSFNSATDSQRNLLLADVSIPPGRYSQIRLFFKEIVIRNGDKEIVATTVPEGTMIPLEILVAADAGEPIFLFWNPNNDSRTANDYHPQFQLRHPEIPPVGSLAFVTNEESGTVAVIDRYAFRVVDIIKVGDGPRGLAYMQQSQELYVANSQSNSISIIDANTRQVVRTISLNFGDTPSRMVLSPDEQTLYIINYGSNDLVSIDTRSYQEIGRVSLGTSPCGIAADQFTGLIYISNQESDNISVYDPASQSVTFVYSLDGAPCELWADADNQILYLSFPRQRTLTVLDARTGGRTTTMNLCAPVTGLAFNRISRQLMVAQGLCSEIALIRPELNLDLGSIKVPGQPGLIAPDPENRYLLAILSDIDSLAIINLNSRQVKTVMEVGRGPYMAVIPG